MVPLCHRIRGGVLLKHDNIYIVLDTFSSEYTLGVQVMANPLEERPRLADLFE